ncbi:hypothetical protein [Streptomyces sp. NPDC001978]|uniref:hypothetical protein n=1 Tax=Streptomyces sp. NPDC001978 TaxID=3364627 RepID=UPI0036D0D848
MKKNRAFAAVALTAGLGLAGVATASASSAPTSRFEHGTTAKATTTAKGHERGTVAVCVFEHGGPGKGTPSKTTVKDVDGKVYVNGKEVPKADLKHRLPGGLKDGCGKLPVPAPGKGGKGGVVVCAIEGGKGDGPVVKGGASKTIVKDVDGKVYVNGEEVSKAALKEKLKDAMKEGKKDKLKDAVKGGAKGDLKTACPPKLAVR